MENSPLAKLPAELRNTIYEYTLYQPEGVHVKAHHNQANSFGCFEPDTALLRDCLQTKHGPDCGCILGMNRYSARSDNAKGQPQSRHLLVLTQTCRQIRVESYAMFFSLNAFYVHELQCSEDGWRPSYQTGLLPNNLEACKRWLYSVGPKLVAIMREFVIEGPQWQHLRHDSQHMETERWITITRQSVPQLFDPMPMPPAVFMTCCFDFSSILLWPVRKAGATQLCSITREPLSRLSPYMSIRFGFAMLAPDAALNEVVEDMTRRFGLFSSHEEHSVHQCTIAKELRELEFAIAAAAYRMQCVLGSGEFWWPPQVVSSLTTHM